MALQNIGASNRDDAFYRYKMPKMITKIEGRGNGIKTNLVNMVEVAKALARPPSYTTKYFGCELGAQSKFDEKAGTSIVNGAHDTAKLAGLLENFIKKYVQCYGCGNPETEIIITKNQTITLKCAACGFVSDVDMRDKLTTFILKNPPEQKKGGKDKKGMRRAEKERLKEGEAVDEETKKVKKDSKKKKGHEDNGAKASKKKSGSDEEEHSPTSSQVDEDEEAGLDNDGVQWQTDTSVEAAQKRIKEQLTTATSEMVMLDKRAHEPEVKDTGAKKDMKAVPKKTSAKKSAAGEDTAEEVNSKMLGELILHDKLVKEIKGHLKDGYTATDFTHLFQTMEGSQQEIMNAYFEALFEGVSKGLAKEVGKKKPHLAKIVHDESSQKLLLGAIEVFCVSVPEAAKEVALVLKVLYDDDILEEDEILGWYDKGAASGLNSKAGNIWRNVKLFAEWLCNAEAESGED